ncbi:MAG: Prochlorococcus phage Syn33 [Bacteroidota bacterium]
MNFLEDCNVVIDKFDDFTFQFIKQEIKSFQQSIEQVEMEKSHDQVYAFQQRLVGELQYFLLPKTEHLIKRKVLEMIGAHEKKFKLFNRVFNDMANLGPEPIFEFERIWVNAQRAGEFIPLHQHSGIYSFAFWVQIPFSIKDQNDNFFNQILVKDRTAMFEFTYPTSTGHICQKRLPVDRSWEGKIAVFPAGLLHQVYPFYGTDELRISISGNIRLANENFK